MLIETVTLVGDSYPTTLSKDSLPRICPRNNRADSRAPLQSLVGRLSLILKPIDGAPFGSTTVYRFHKFT